MRIGKKQIKGNLTGDAWIKVYDQVTGPALHANTVLYIQGDTITDGATGKTVTANGGAAVSIINPKFRQIYRSIAFDGSGDYLSLVDHVDWDLGTAPYTIDCWIRTNGKTPNGAYIVGNRGAVQHVGGTWDYWFLELDTDGVPFTYAYGTVNNYIIRCTRNAFVDDGRWHHVAAVRTSTSAGGGKIYIDGIDMTDPSYNTDAVDYTNANGPMLVGGGSGLPANEHLNGNLSGVRITKGTALWSSNFTPDTHPPGRMTFYAIGSDGYGYPIQMSGNTDEEYRLLIRHINGYNGVGQLWLRFNNDSGTNYGYQRVYGQATTVTATQLTATTQITLAAGNSLNNSSMSDTLIYAKSGYPRTALTTVATGMATTSVDTIQQFGYVWNNTTDNITGLYFRSDQDNGIGVGTSFELWKKAERI
jgi:hypothetical protein